MNNEAWEKPWIAEIYVAKHIFEAIKSNIGNSIQITILYYYRMYYTDHFSIIYKNLNLKIAVEKFYLKKLANKSKIRSDSKLLLFAQVCFYMLTSWTSYFLYKK